MTSQLTQASEFYPEIPVFNLINPEMSCSTFFRETGNPGVKTPCDEVFTTFLGKLEQPELQ